MKNISRIGATVTLAGTGLLLSAGSAFAVAPTPPDPSAAITDAGGSLSTGVVDTTVALIPYAVPVLLLAWGFSTAKNMIGTRKKAAK